MALRAALNLGVATKVANNHRVSTLDPKGKVVWSLRRDSDGCVKAKAATKKATELAKKLTTTVAIAIVEETPIPEPDSCTIVAAAAPQVETESAASNRVVRRPRTKRSQKIPVAKRALKDDRTWTLQNNGKWAMLANEARPKLSWAMQQEHSEKVQGLISTANAAAETDWSFRNLASSSASPGLATGNNPTHTPLLKAHCRPRPAAKNSANASKRKVEGDIAILLGRF